MAELTENNMLNLIDSFEGKISNDELAEIKDFVVHREWGVGFELMCAKLYKNKTHINEKQFNHIKSIGRDMELNENSWDFLKQQINSSSN